MLRTVTLFAVAAAAAAQLEAVCVFSGTTGNEDVKGDVRFTEAPTGMDIDVAITGLKEGKHGIHVHTYGDITGPTGTSTGGHYNPFDEEHGCFPVAPAGGAPPIDDRARKAGDMGNVVVDGAGRGIYRERGNELMKLSCAAAGCASVLGRGVIVHIAEDNCVRVEGAGGDLSAGARVGQCTIGLSEPKSAAALASKARIAAVFAAWNTTAPFVADRSIL